MAARQVIGRYGPCLVSTTGFHCTCCGKHHDEMPMAFSIGAPAYWSPEIAAHPDSVLTPDQCIINGEHFFIRGNIEIPVHDSDVPFSWGVWVSLSERSFEHASENWEREGREHSEPYFGWLSVVLPYEPTTINLKTSVHTQPVGTRPDIELEHTDHPLAVEQRTGITLTRVQQIVETMMH